MPRRLPPLYALRAFEAASRHNSFTRAAEELSITQSAVSRHIRTLEEHFACRLFQRSGRNLQLTEAARLLLPGVREGFAALERACHTLNAEDDILRPTYWNGAVDPHWLSRDWSEAHPEVGVPELIGIGYRPDIMDEVNSWTVYEGFRRALESSPHGAVHAGVGGGRGDMGPNSSPNGMYFLPCSKKRHVC